MGKTMGRWLRELLQGGKKKKKVQEGHAVDESGASKEKRRWGFTRSKRDDAVAPPKPAGEEWRGGGAARSYASSVTSASSHSACAALHRSVPGAMDEAEQNKRAIVVAAATAAVAEAAVAAAQAAAAVVRLTSSGRSAGFYGAKAEFSAAIKIQTAFRGYLARRALRALRSLVKLQALVRGHIVRKQAAETLRCMQALVRVQARARVCRALSSEMSLRRRTGNLGLGRKVEGRSWVDQWAEEQRLRGGGKQPPARVAGAAADDENHDRVLEVDTGKPRLNPKRRNGTTATQQLSSSSLASDQNSRSFATTAQFSVHSPSSVDMPLQQSLSPLVTATMVSDEKLGESPNLYSSSGMRTGGAAGRGTLAAALSDCSSSFFSSYSDHPSYMSCTESSRAKTRSQSAPKQRPEFEKPAAGGQRGHVGAGGAAAANRTAAPASSSMQVKFTSKAYPGSGRLDRLGMPVRF